jgi:DNA-binding PadR family transcriptional regulator
MAIEKTYQDLLPSLSRKEALILALLTNNGNNMFGLEMVEASNGALKRGTIYVTLQRMQEKGFIDSKLDPRPAPEIGIPRRLYWPTEIGNKVFAAYQAMHQIINTASPEGEPALVD